MSEQPKKYADWGLIKRVFGLAHPYRSIFAFAASLSIILAPVAVLRPYLVQRTVDDCIIQSQGEGIGVMIILLVCVLLLQR